MDDYQLLRHVRNATEMGVIGIDCVADRTAHSGLTSALEQQRAEYSELYAQAGQLLAERGESAKPVSQMAKAYSRMIGRAKGSSDSRIAAMMIQGNTRGMIQSGQKLSQAAAISSRTQALAKRLLQTESNNIEQMKPFL